MTEKRLTTNAGAPVVDNQNVMTAGRRCNQLCLMKSSRTG